MLAASPIIFFSRTGRSGIPTTFTDVTQADGAVRVWDDANDIRPALDRLVRVLDRVGNRHDVIGARIPAAGSRAGRMCCEHQKQAPGARMAEHAESAVPDAGRPSDVIAPALMGLARS